MESRNVRRNTNSNATAQPKDSLANFYALQLICSHPQTVKLWAKNANLTIKKDWLSSFDTASENWDNMQHSAKVLLLFSTLAECEKQKEKVLVFSQSLHTLDMIEGYMKIISDNKHKNSSKLAGFHGTWKENEDYFRLDGNTNKL